MIYLDAYIKDPKGLEEGHFPEQIYARVPVVEAEGKVITWLCRLTEDQYRTHEKAGRLVSWKDLSEVSAKKTIKDRANKDKVIPTITFGGILNSPGSPSLTTDFSEVSDKLVESPPEKEDPGLGVDAPKKEKK